MEPSGEVRYKQVCCQLTNARTKQQARERADAILRPINDGTVTPESTMTLCQYVEDVYLPYVSEQKRLSTYKGYNHLWKRHLRSRSLVPLRDFRTVECENILREIARTEHLSRASLAHVKFFMSGAFRHARRQGVLNGENPVRDVVLPKGVPSKETYAYSLEEILKMLMVVPEPAATVLATAAFTGARRGEIRGLLWENYSAARSVLLNPSSASTQTSRKPKRVKHQFL